MLEKKYYILWTAYFDRRKTRSEGRKVPLSLAVDNPTIKDLEKAVAKLGLEYVVERDKAYPRDWFESKGRILVLKESFKGNKNKLLKEVAKILKQFKK